MGLVPGTRTQIFPLHSDSSNHITVMLLIMISLYLVTWFFNSFPRSATGSTSHVWCVPTLFSICVAVMPHLIADRLPGVKIQYCMARNLFNISQFCSKSRIINPSITDLQYVDDYAMCAHLIEEILVIHDWFCEVYEMFGLTANFKKTKILCQPTLNKSTSPPHITIRGQSLENFEHLPYLHSHISQKLNINNNI